MGKPKTHFRLVPAGPPPYPRTAWTKCGRTVPYTQAANERSKDVTCLRCNPPDDKCPGCERLGLGSYPSYRTRYLSAFHAGRANFHRADGDLVSAAWHVVQARKERKP